MSKQITLNELKVMNLNKLKRVDLAGLIYDLDTLYLNQERKCNKNEWVKRSLNGVGSAKGWLKAELIEIVARKIIEALEMNKKENEIEEDETLKELLSGEDTFRYSMLDRLASDCRYYLGNGDRSKEVLWAKDEKDQIKYMKALYNSFSEDNKPKFISMEDINQFEKEMTDKKYIKDKLQEELNKISIKYDKNNFLINQHMISYEKYEATERRLKKQYEYIENQLKSIV